MLTTFLVIIAALLVQIQIIPVIGLRADILALVTIYYGLAGGWKRGVAAGLAAGILQDVFSGGVLGLSAVSLGMCGLLSGYLRKMLVLKYRVMRIGLVFLLTVSNLCLYALLSSLFFKNIFLNIFVSNWFWIGLGNAVLAALLFWITERYD